MITWARVDTPEGAFLRPIIKTAEQFEELQHLRAVIQAQLAAASPTTKPEQPATALP